MTTFEKIRTFIFVGAATAVVLTGCGDQATDTSSQADNTKPESSIVESSDSFENSFNSDHVSSGEDNPVNYRELAYKTMIDYVCRAYATQNECSYDEAYDNIISMKLMSIWIDENEDFYNDEYGVATYYLKNKQGEKIFCTSLGVSFANNRGRLISVKMGVPMDENLIDFCSRYSVEPNKLGNFIIGEAEIRRMADDTAQAFIEVLDSSALIEENYNSDFEPSM